MAKSSTTFGKNKQPSKGRGKSERTKILEAMKREKKTENGFYDLLIQKAFNVDDNFTFNELLKRISPIAKSVAPMIKFDFPKSAKPHEQASAVMIAVANGEIPPDIGALFVSSIKSMIEIEEYTDLKERIEAIEKSLGVCND